MFYDYRLILPFLLLILALVFAFNGMVMVKTKFLNISYDRKKFIEGPFIAVAGIFLIILSIGCLVGFIAIVW